jgi:hypothetical protein
MLLRLEDLCRIFLNMFPTLTSYCAYKCWNSTPKSAYLWNSENGAQSASTQMPTGDGMVTNLMPWQPISRFPFLSDSLCTSGIDILSHLELCLTVSSALVSASVSTSIVQSFKSSCRKQVNKHQTYALSCSCHYDKVKKTYIFFVKTTQIIWLSTRTSTVKLYSRQGELFCSVNFQEITLIKGLNLSDHAESYISHMETAGKQFMCHDTHIYWADKASWVNIICCFMMLGASLYGIDSVDTEI